jgi:hypothetical protein
VDKSTERNEANMRKILIVLSFLMASILAYADQNDEVVRNLVKQIDTAEFVSFFEGLNEIPWPEQFETLNTVLNLSTDDSLFNLIKASAGDNTLRTVSINYWTNPLIWAISNDRTAFALRLVEAFPELRSRTETSGHGGERPVSPIAYSVLFDNVEITKSLINHGVEIKTLIYGLDDIRNRLAKILVSFPKRYIVPVNLISLAQSSSMKNLLKESGLPSIYEWKETSFNDDTARIIDSDVNFRAGPSRTSTIIRKFQKNEIVHIAKVKVEFEVINKETGNWVCITDERGVSGWVFSKFIFNMKWAEE